MLHTPAYAAAPDTQAVHELIHRYGFATVISQSTEEPVISHLPLLLNGKGDRLVGHLARANPHSQLLGNDASVTCIFHGPHGYMSPAWYVDPLNVPTWNYAVAHVTGRVRRIDDADEIERILDATVKKYETELGTGWSYDLPADFRAQLVKAIVGFEIEITCIEGKFKLSQNRKAPDRAAAVAGASRFYKDSNPDLVRMMKEVFQIE